METLDEVIKAIENCLNPADKLDNCREECPYIHCCDPMSIPVKNDILHYLKEYRDKLSNDEKAYKRGYSCGYAKAKEDEEISRRWEESFRASQMPWNHYTEMGG